MAEVCVGLSYLVFWEEGVSLQQQLQTLVLAHVRRHLMPHHNTIHIRGEWMGCRHHIIIPHTCGELDGTYSSETMVRQD